MPLGDITEVHFALGKNDVLQAQQVTKSSMSWIPADEASIEIRGFSMQGNEKGVDAMIQKPGNWGFIRLLAQARPGVGKGLYEGYLIATWNSFLVDGKPLVSSDGPAKAGLLFRTSARPNPLEPGFFTLTFATKVFRAR